MAMKKDVRVDMCTFTVVETRYNNFCNISLNIMKLVS
jgi:hypothetical protein